MNTSSLRFCVLLAITALFVASCTAQKPEMIDVGDHKLAIVRAGNGGPIVVFEWGGGRNSGIDGGQTIRSRVSRFTSTVAYARAGRSPSEAAKSSRTLTAVVEDLHTLLERAGCQPPYVMVGGSLGGLYVRAYATMHPNEIAGLVLIEGTHERQWIELDRLLGLAPGKSAAAVIAGFKSKKDEATAQEMEGLADVWASGKLGLPGTLPDVPMVVITGLRPDRPWLAPFVGWLRQRVGINPARKATTSNICCPQ
jgi:pimeloyl-ACP methyl ester carboxylesterase